MLGGDLQAIKPGRLTLRNSMMVIAAFAAAALQGIAVAQSNPAATAAPDSLEARRAAIANEKIVPLVVPAGIDADAYCLVVVEDYSIWFSKIPEAERGQWASIKQPLASASAFYMGTVVARRDDAELAKILPPAAEVFSQTPKEARKMAFASCMQQVTLRRLRVVDAMSEKK